MDAHSDLDFRLAQLRPLDSSILLLGMCTWDNEEPVETVFSATSWPCRRLVEGLRCSVISGVLD